MEISKISTASIQQPELVIANKANLKVKTQDQNYVETEKKSDIFDKKVSFLADSLDNNNQLDNNHPLGKADYKPIDNMTEAMNLLGYFNSPEYRNVASNVQANVSHDSFLALFAD